MVEPANRNKVIAKIGFYNMGGTNVNIGDFEMTRRIQSAYSFTGKWLGDFLRRKSKKK